MMRSGASIGSTEESVTCAKKHHTTKPQMRRMPTVSTAGPTRSPRRTVRSVAFRRSWTTRRYFAFSYSAVS